MHQKPQELLTGNNNLNLRRSKLKKLLIYYHLEVHHNSKYKTLSPKVSILWIKPLSHKFSNNNRHKVLAYWLIIVYLLNLLYCNNNSKPKIKITYSEEWTLINNLTEMHLIPNRISNNKINSDFSKSKED